MTDTNTEFELRGVNHVALVCKDMARTVDFYTNVLGMPLTKTIDLPEVGPGGGGQHFFFDMGGGNALAFFWFPEAPAAAPGIASPEKAVGFAKTTAEWVTAHGSMNHIAFDVDQEKFDEYYDKLQAKGVEVSPILNHDTSKWQVSREVTDDVFIRSFYFMDPDGIMLEFAAWTRALRPDEKLVAPKTAADAKQAEPVS